MGILVNSIVTYCAEKLIIDKVTKSFDNKKTQKKLDNFDELMDSLRGFRDGKASKDVSYS
jgi:hypothetical protein